MRRTLLVALVIALFSTALAAQGEAPRYFSMFEVHTVLGHQPQYEQAIKDTWAAMKEAELDFPVFVSQSTSDPGTYSFVTLLGNMADFDEQDTAFNTVLAANPSVVANLTRHAFSNESSIIRPRVDLSYRPAQPRVTNEAARYRVVTVLRVKPVHVRDVAKALEEIAALNKKHGIADGYEVYQDVIGEGPWFAIRRQALSEADYYTQKAKNGKTLGAEANALRAKVAPWIESVEYSASIPRPDLHYLPGTN